jgi:outer membrane protein TolC
MFLRLTIIFLICVCATESIAQNTLDYYLTHAINNSPLLKDLQNQVYSFSVDSQIVRATLRPQVVGNSNNMYAPVIKGVGYDPAITNIAQVSALLSVNKTILSNKSIASQLGSFRIQSQSAANNIRITQQDLKKTITDQYIVTFGEQLQLDLNREIGELLLKEDTLLRRLTQNNVYRQTDYLAFQVTLQQQQLAGAELEVQYKFDLATLKYLAGIQDTLGIAYADTVLHALVDPDLRLLVIPEYSLSPFYQQFVLDSLQLTNERSLIDINYRPKVNLFADGGYNSSLQFDPAKNFGYSFGLSLSVPIYDGHQRNLQYSKIDIQERTRQARRDFFVNQHQQQVILLKRQLVATEDLIKKINKQIKYSETLIQTNHKLLATGDVRVTDFILTINNYLNARNLVAQNYINRLKIVNQLNYWATP